MFLIQALTAILSEAKALLVQEEFPPIIEEFETLRAAVLQQDALNVVNELDRLLYLDNEEAIKQQLTSLCEARFSQNKDTLLDLLAHPMLPGNQLYFTVAKTIYPKANFRDLCKLLMPDITQEWVVQLAAVRGSAKRRRLQEQVALHDIALDDEVSCLADLSVIAQTLSQIIRVHNSLFAIDNIAAFDFNMHAQFYALLKEDNPDLLQAIAEHNEEFAELYLRLKRMTEKGASVREVILPIVKRMAISGASAGFVEFASVEGSMAALRLVEYYHALPQAFKEQVGACRSMYNNPNIAKIISNIEHRSCIETAALELASVLENPENTEVLDASPYVSDEEKKALSQPYLGIKKGEPLVDVHSLPKTLSAPIALSQKFYRQMELRDPDAVVSLLTALPISEYEAFLSLANFEDIFFMSELHYIYAPLNVKQREAVIEALMKPLIRNRLMLHSSNLAAALVSTRDKCAIIKLIGHMTSVELLTLINEEDEDGRTPLHHLVFTSAGCSQLLALYPNYKELKKALKKKDDYGQTVWHAAARYVDTLKVLEESYKGVDEVLQAIMIRDGFHHTVIHSAATELQSLKLLLAYFQEGDDDEQNEDATIEVLLRFDLLGNTVFHLAANNPETLCYLLSQYSEPTDAMGTLCRKNHEGKSVLSLDEINYPVLGAVLELFLEQEASDEEMASFLCHPNVHDEKTIFGELSSNAAGAAILVSLYLKRPLLCVLLIGLRTKRTETGITKMGFFAQNGADSDSGLNPGDAHEAQSSGQEPPARA